ncbi:5-oxoprolinase subunit PxpB [Solemya elarraichensis gill symbiont]|uniref:Allophanate hydrolase n=1 Tax=Solemya elarraichensis gill symbiont TaxID=1918949 RepID=A0A1T2L697_9GAMM|nr:5-oxoprolinase subunit PxpB [Solemya elarraichensis gill symbiont]OOZ40629.1 allophanate hydrolase [Solemya elarraichensis gill symbiont]
MRIEALNENSSIVYLGDEISDDVSARVGRALAIVRQSLGPLLTDLVPSYTSLLLYYDPDRIDHEQLHQYLVELLDDDAADLQESVSSALLEVPVYYGEEVALDLQALSEFAGLAPDEVISIHSDSPYRVYAIGFAPGFAYLGKVDQRIAMPRMQKPRLRVPAGSVAIADSQTAVYPAATPGGWRIIGRTPMQMIDWESDSLTQIEVGAEIRFRPIGRQEYLDLGGQLDEDVANEL